MKYRYLTKSRFQLAQECPRKLYYYGKSKYPNNKNTPFLAALAEGGFQVGALAKCYFPEGYDISEIDIDKSLQQTNELLKKEKVTIFEAAILYKNYFIRIDILKKDGKK